MISASAALDFRKEKPGVGVVRLHEWVRTVSAPIVGDRSLSGDTMALAKRILKEGV